MQYLNELIMQDLPAIILLVVGFVLIVIEMYIPGFGVPGISGIICVIVGIALWAESWVQALVMTVIVVALLCIALSISMHSISKGRLAKSRLILNEVANAPELNEKDMGYFVGREGIVKNTLRPAGIGEFDGIRLNIVSEGEFIQAGSKVRIDHVEGNRIVVSQINA